MRKDNPHFVCESCDVERRYVRFGFVDAHKEELIASFDLDMTEKDGLAILEAFEKFLKYLQIANYSSVDIFAGFFCTVCNSWVKKDEPVYYVETLTITKGKRIDYFDLAKNVLARFFMVSAAYAAGGIEAVKRFGQELEKMSKFASN